MWDIEIADGGIGGQRVEAASWKTERPARTVEEFYSTRRAVLTVRHDGSQWQVLDGERPLDAGHAGPGAALAAGEAFVEEAARQLDEAMLAHAGLSGERWSFDRWSFVSRNDPADRIVPCHDGWEARIGSVTLPKCASAGEAQAVLDAGWHLRSASLPVLERAYACGGVAVEMDEEEEVARLENEGMIEVASSDGGARRVTITEAGMEALGRDPRGLPMAVRERIFEKGMEYEEYRGRPQAVKADWNGFIGTGLYEGNAVAIREALECGFELWEDVVESDPQEICIRGSGITKSGARLGHGTSIALFEPWWGDTAESSRILARVIVDSRVELAELCRGTHRAAHPAPSP